MTTRGLVSRFRVWQRQGRPLVLATVFETEGSTYSKPGARMLITDDNKFQGMLSGGCLEGDLADRAEQVLATGEAASVTYDLGTSDDELWGLGVGCDGLMRILLQPLVAANSYEPFATIADCLDGDDVSLAATIITSEHDHWRPGATFVINEQQVRYSEFGDGEPASLMPAASQALNDGESRTVTVTQDNGVATVLLGLLKPPPRLLVLGAGLDAEPVVRFAAELGWRVVIQDHRPAYIDKGEFAAAERVISVPASEISSELEFDDIDAAIIMSHHLATDRVYLATLAGTRISYIGLLGPEARRDRLLSDLIAESGIDLADRVHGPAGLAIGASGPAAIGLSIIAEIQQALSRRFGN